MKLLPEGTHFSAQMFDVDSPISEAFQPFLVLKLMSELPNSGLLSKVSRYHGPAEAFANLENHLDIIFKAPQENIDVGRFRNRIPDML